MTGVTGKKATKKLKKLINRMVLGDELNATYFEMKGHLSPYWRIYTFNLSLFLKEKELEDLMSSYSHKGVRMIQVNNHSWIKSYRKVCD